MTQITTPTEAARRLARVNRLIQVTGLTASGWCKSAGLSQNTLGNFRTANGLRDIDLATQKKLSEAIKIPLSALTLDMADDDFSSLIDEIGRHTIGAAIKRLPSSVDLRGWGANQLQADEFLPKTIDIPAAGSLPLDVPVYGTAVGGEDADFEMNGEVVDRVRRPPGLANVKNAFGLYVVGTSMEPRFREGDLIFIHPSRHPSPGCDVVVELHAVDEFGRHKALLKEYRGKTPTKLLLSQHNPASPVEVPLDHVKQVLRVMTTAELMGV